MCILFFVYFSTEEDVSGEENAYTVAQSARKKTKRRHTQMEDSGA
jgi:hypothetical protein